MANWIRIQSGNVINLDLFNFIRKRKDDNGFWIVQAFMAEKNSGEAECYAIKDFVNEKEAEEFIGSVTCAGREYKSAAHDLAQILA